MSIVHDRSLAAVGYRTDIDNPIWSNKLSIDLVNPQKLGNSRTRRISYSTSLLGGGDNKQKTFSGEIPEGDTKGAGKSTFILNIYRGTPDC